MSAPRWGYRLSEIAQRTGLPRSSVDRHARRAGIPRRKIGAAVLLEARAVERAFGFESPAPRPVTPGAEALAVARRLVG